MAQRLQAMDELFKGRHFEREVIVLEPFSHRTFPTIPRQVRLVQCPKALAQRAARMLGAALHRDRRATAPA